MKLIAPLFLLLSTLSFGQYFVPDSSSWETSYDWFAVSGPSSNFMSYNTWYSQALGDTVVGVDTFQVIQIQRDLGMPGDTTIYETWYIQKDSNIVYYTSDLVTKKMLFDFNLSVGDSVIKEVELAYIGSGTDTLIVTSVDTVTINNVDRKRIIFNEFSFYAGIGWSNLTHPRMQWVEGIGDLEYGLIPYDGMSDYRIDFNGSYKLDCFKEGLTPIYGYCGPLEIKDNKDEIFNVFPNPARDFIKVNYNGNSETIMLIYGMMGQVVKRIILTPGQNVISTANLKAGNYLMVSNTEEGFSSLKLVVQ